MARRPASDPTTRHPSQLLALAIGVVYTLVGIAGFLVTGLENFAAGNSDINFLSLNGADNGLHLVSAIAGVAIALWPADRTVPQAEVQG